MTNKKKTRPAATSVPRDLGDAGGRRELRAAIVAGALAVGLSYVFWQPLWEGGGLVGGDTYTYFFPQKTFLSDELKAGRVPQWCPLVGHGYPVIAESQTGVFYPLNLVLFRLFDVNTAYNAAQIVHYVLAFVATWLLSRRMGLSAPASCFAALVFVYGWFPARICLEWAIIGGVYFPLLLWCTESFLQTRDRRYLLGTSALLGVDLSAGHFNLAFIAILTALAYAACRLTFVRDNPEDTGHREDLQRGRSFVLITAAIAFAFMLAAVQLAPTWELKQLSQRADVGPQHDPGYGHLPPWYFSQIVAPWLWYAPNVNADDALNSIKTLSIASPTNKVEAHLYFGLLPFALAVGGLIERRRRGSRTPGVFLLWGTLGLLAAVYATGWLLPVTSHLPGFKYFSGPGRYGIVTTLAVALLAAYTVDRILQRTTAGPARVAVFVLLFAVSACDLWFVRCYWNRNELGEPNWYADLVPDPPIKHRDESAVRAVLSRFPQPVRLFGPGQNLPTVLGFSMTPQYLGLGPAAYFDPRLTMPRAEHDPPTSEDIKQRIVWLQKAGVTHVLSENPLDAALWPARLVWTGVDALLNSAWARREPLYLYELEGSRGRVSLRNAGASVEGQARVRDVLPDRVVVETDSQRSAELVLTDLHYPGWTITVDGKPAAAHDVDGMFRGVNLPAGHHEVIWSYHPASLTRGAAVSAVGVLVLLLLTALTLRRARGESPGEPST